MLLYLCLFYHITFYIFHKRIQKFNEMYVLRPVSNGRGTLQVRKVTIIMLLAQ